MEKMKLIFTKFFRDKFVNKAAEEVKYDHIVTIEDDDGRTNVTQIPCKTGKRKQCRFAFMMDVLFCCFISLLWVAAFSFFIQFVITARPDKTSVYEYLYLSYFVVVLIVCMSSIHFESVFVRGFESFNPKIAVVVKKNQTRKSYILRMRLAGETEFVESELEENQLTYDDVLSLCCKELDLKQDNVLRLCKVPETRIRNDNDIRRFRRLEYVEVFTKN